MSEIESNMEVSQRGEVESESENEFNELSSN